MPTLLLVDGSSYLYRAFHAMPDLRNKAGEPTGAIYGVINMLRRLAADYKAEYRACVFDAKGKTFRDDLYPAYKANRPSMPDELARQIEPLHACVQALGWPLLVIEGVEADDVIGTLARQATQQRLATVISTGDKDLAQLVNPHVRLVNTMSNETLDEAGVVAKFGVPPQRIVDYFALVGDAVDNVPGVDKVGPKTAAKWLQQYGSLDEIVAHAGEITGAVGENLRRAREFLPLGRKLVTVVCDLELPLQLEDLAPRDPDREKLIDLFSRLEFRTWLREVHGSGGRGTAAAGAGRAGASGGRRRFASRALRNDPDLGTVRPLAPADRVGAAHRPRHRNHEPRSDGGAAGGHVLRHGGGGGGLSAAGPRRPRRAAATAPGRSIAAAAAVAGVGAERQGRAESEI